MLAGYCRASWGKSVVHTNMAAHLGIDFPLPARARENAVMPHPGLQIMLLFVWLERSAQLVGGKGLSRRADIVTLALHGQERCSANGARVHVMSAPFKASSREIVPLKHTLDSLEIKLGVQIKHGE